jgi:predicted kinase
MAKLIMMVGPSYSGKSTVAHELAQKEKAVIVSSDGIRAEWYGDESIQGDNQKIFQEVHHRIKVQLRANKSVIYDATNLSAKRRMAFLKDLNNSKIGCEKECHVVVADLDTIKKRMKIRERKVPFAVVEHQLKSFQCPHCFEGWGQIILHNTGSKSDAEQLLRQCEGIDHDNPNHSFDIAEHMKAAFDFYRDTNFVMDTVLWFAIRYHDVGKFYTKTFKNAKGEPTEEAHFYGHQNYGAYLLLCSSCFMSDEQVLRLGAIVTYHMEHYLRTEERLEAFYDMIGEDLTRDLMVMALCDKKAH